MFQFKIVCIQQPLKNESMQKIYFDNRSLHLLDEYKMFLPRNKFLNRIFHYYTDINSLNTTIDFFQNTVQFENLLVFHRNKNRLKRNIKRCFKFVKAAGGLVYNPKGEILVIKRAGVWDLPKGHLEVGEKLPDCALREVSEECGINGMIISKKLLNTFHTYPSKNGVLIMKKTYWYQMIYAGNNLGKPQTEEKIEEVRWLPPNQLDMVYKNTYNSLVEVLNFVNHQ